MGATRPQRLFALLLCLWTSCCILANAQNIALNYNNEMVLRNALLNVDNPTVSPAFVAGIIEAINNSSTVSTPLGANVHIRGDDLVVVSGAWSSGTQANVESSVYALESMYASWRESATGNLAGMVSRVSVEFYGQQPTLVDVTDYCRFNDVVTFDVTDTCYRNLTVDILTPTQVSNGDALRLALCTVLPTECSLIVLTGISQEFASAGSSTVYNRMSFTILSSNRDLTLATLVMFARHASALSAFMIAYVRVNGVQVYYEGDTPVLTIISSDTAECANQLWYLIFLLILLPVVIIVSQRCYYLGAASGKRSIKNTEADIRAGVHVSATPWNAFGGPGANAYRPGLNYRAAPPAPWAGAAGGRYAATPSAYGAYAQQQQQQQLQQQYAGWQNPMEGQQRGWRGPMATQQQWGQQYN